MTKERVRSILIKTSLFTAIKLLYVFMTVYFLKDLPYVGFGSYGIDFDLGKEIIGTTICIFMGIFFASMPSKGTFIDSLLTMLFVIYYIPLVSAYSINNTSLAFLIKSNLYFIILLLCVWLFIKMPTEDQTTLPKQENDLICRAFDPPLVQLMCIVVCVFCLIYKISYNGLSFTISFDSKEIYATRGEFQSTLDAMSGSLFSYIFSIVRNLADLVIPLYLYYCVTQRKWLGLIISILGLLSVFSMTSSKSTLVFFLVLLAVALLRKTKFIKNFCFWFVIAILALFFVCILENLVFNSCKIYTLLVRRVFYYPAWLNSLYFEFFDQNAKVMWTQDTFLLQMISSHRYSEGILGAISNYFYHGEVPSPNTGMFAEAYLHWGDLGIAIYPILLTVVMWFTQKVFSKYGNELSILIAAKLVLKLTNVPLVRTDFVLSFILFIVAMSILPKFVFRRKEDSIST